MDRAHQPDAYVVAHVREALASDPRTNELHVEVTLAGNRIFLTGEVASDESRRAVAEVVEELAPDREVRNETSVPPLAAPEEPEELP